MKCENCDHYNACMRLIVAEYEDLIVCSNFKDKGLVFESPVKAGQSIFMIFEDADTSELLVYGEKITEVGTKGFWLSSITTEENIDDFVSYNEIRKTVFLTKEDAERALGAFNGN